MKAAVLLGIILLIGAASGWTLTHVETCERAASTNGSTHWKNWAGTLVNNPHKIYCPSSLSDIVAIINEATNDNRRIRCVGHAHSWSPISVTDDILVVDTYLNQIGIPFQTSNGGWRVTVQAGVNNRQLADYLASHNPPLVTSTNVIALSVLWGGTTSTGSHGSGRKHRSVSDFISGMTLVLSNGTVVTFDENSPRRYIRAARMALGMAGVIYNITLKVKPAYNVKVWNLNVPWMVAFEKDYLRNCAVYNDYCALSWMPYNGRGQLSLDPILSPTPMDAASDDMVWVRIHNRTNEPLTLANETLDNQFNYLQIFYFNLFLEGGNIPYSQLPANPEYTPYFGFFTTKALNPIDKVTVEQQRYAQHYFGDTDGALAHGVGTFTSLWDKNLNVENWEVVETQLRNVVLKVYEEGMAGRFPLNQVTEVRFQKSSRSFLHPTFKRNKTDPVDIYWAAIDFSSYPNTPHYFDFTNSVVSSWISDYGTVPHWAHSFDHISGMISHIKSELKYGIKKFNKIRQELDPNNVMGNTFTDSLFL